MRRPRSIILRPGKQQDTYPPTAQNWNSEQRPSSLGRTRTRRPTSQRAPTTQTTEFPHAASKPPPIPRGHVADLTWANRREAPPTCARRPGDEGLNLRPNIEQFRLQILAYLQVQDFACHFVV